METKLEDLKHIRSMMERSSKFLSLSGMSGIVAGMVALIGSVPGYLLFTRQLQPISGDLMVDYLVLLALILGFASLGGFYFSSRKAKKDGAKIWTTTNFQILKDFAIPMVVGGIFCLIQFYHGIYIFLPATMLIFYGLALIYVGARTYRDVKMLGACEIILGLLAAFFIYNGLIFWTIGFGMLHIVYGVVMYIKYDRKSEKKEA